MEAIIALAVQLLPLLIQAGMTIEPTIRALVGATADNVPETLALLHQEQASALTIINDPTRDVPV